MVLLGWRREDDLAALAATLVQTRRDAIMATGETNLDQERAEFVAVQPGGVRLVFRPL